MTHVRRSLPLVAVLLGLALFTAIMLIPAPAGADCGGDVSSCKTCHEERQELPVNQRGPWHVQHAFSDFCADCHAGDPAASDAEGAHLNMRPVLADPEASCSACHIDSYAELAAAYQQEAADEEGDAAAPAAYQPPPPGSNNGLFLGINLAVLAGLIALVWSFEKGPLARFAAGAPGPTARAPVPRNPLARRRWSPYAAGAGLGLVAIGALWLSQQPLGSSGAFLTTASLLLKATGSSLSESVYFQFIMPPQVTWQLLLVLGVILGALLSALSSGDFRLESVPDRWASVFGPSRFKRWAAIFAGGFILEYGASIAGGCTSGLAIAGSLQLSGAGFLFIASLFTTGLITARLLYGREY